VITRGFLIIGVVSGSYRKVGFCPLFFLSIGKN